MNSVARNQGFSLNLSSFTKASGDRRLVLLESRAVKTQMQSIGAELRLHRVEQDRLQVAAVDRELRPGVARALAERLAIDELAEPVEEGRFGGLYCDCF